MKVYQQEFIQFALSNKALQFGNFSLKSGRKSPYFFNAGIFNDGDRIAKLGYFYAQTILDANLSYDMLFGPAYKGIPLVTSTVISLSSHFNCNKPFAFNRKEIKDHGERGNIVGSPLSGKILIIDDVITAGTAINESARLIQQANAELAGVIIALDREERGNSKVSAVEEISKIYNIPVISIIKFSHLLDYVAANFDAELIDQMNDYRCAWGVI